MTHPLCNADAREEVRRWRDRSGEAGAWLRDAFRSHDGFSAPEGAMLCTGADDKADGSGCGAVPSLPASDAALPQSPVSPHCDSHTGAGTSSTAGLLARPAPASHPSLPVGVAGPRRRLARALGLLALALYAAFALGVIALAAWTGGD